jgi:hypothetical protein
MAVKLNLVPILKVNDGHVYFELSIGMCKLTIESVVTFPQNIYVFNLPVLNTPIILSVSIFGLLLFKIGLDHTSQSPTKEVI